MCTIFVIRELLARWPLVIAANRDEMLDRPWRPPELELGDPTVLCPRDVTGGGTWIGVNSAGLAVAVTNRTFMAYHPERRSRGLLCREALGCHAVALARACVREAVGREAYNGFNLILADPQAAWLFTYGEGLHQERELVSGVQVITSQHDLNPGILDAHRESMERFARAANGEVSNFEAEITRVLGDHRQLDTYYAVCKHGGRYGTRSAAILALSAQGQALFRFAPGRPCETELESVGGVEGMVR